MVNAEYKFLSLVEYKNFSRWAVKNYLGKEIKSIYRLEEIGKHTKHQTKKMKLFDYPNQIFGILGISNEIGMFDAYEEIGSKINQPYKVVENGFLAYNPYRINVGSVGLKTEEIRNSYISPAYVVFSCKKTLSSEYLYIIIRSDTFNRLIRENTTGSVRQTLAYDILSDIRIPLPSLSLQETIVSKYKQTLDEAIQCERQADELESGIDKLLFEELGIEELRERYSVENKYKFLKFVDYSNVSQWGIDFIVNQTIVNSKFYKSLPISSLCEVGSGGTPNRSVKDFYYGDIPWIKTGEVLDDIIYDSEEKITKKALENSSARLYPAGSLLIAMYGQGKTRGRTAKLGIDATTNQACAVLYNIDNTRIDTDFLWVYLQGEYERLRALAYGNNQPNLNAQMIKDYPVFLPPLEVQKKIVEKVFKVKEQIKQIRSTAATLREKAKKDFEEEVFSEA